MSAIATSILSSPEAIGIAASAAKGAASAIAGAAARSVWKKVSGSAEAKALNEPVAIALVRAVEDSRAPSKSATDRDEVDWWSSSGERLLAPFADERVAEYVVAAALRSPVDVIPAQGALLATLEHAGHNFAELARDLGVDAEQFLHVLPGTLADEITAAAFEPESPLRSLAQLSLLRHISESLSVHEIAPLPPQARVEQLAQLLADEQAWHEAALRQLPYLVGLENPLALDTVVSVKVGVRRQIPTAADGGSDVYTPASARADVQAEKSLSVDEVLARHPRLAVLGDPGMGKTWMMHTRAARAAKSCRDALVHNSIDPSSAPIPIAMRCDTLAAHESTQLGKAAVAVLAERHRVSPALRVWLEDHVTSGPVFLLLDALDEVPRSRRDHLGETIRAWERAASPHSRVLLTSRIGGYQTTMRSRDLPEVELLPFTVLDVDAYVAAWELESKSAAALHERLRTPSIGGLARVPLLLALLCQLARESDELPMTRADIYGRIVRRFLRAENRANNAPIDGSDPFAGDPREREQRLLEVLRPLAFNFANTERGWLDQMPAREVLRILREHRDLLPEGADPAAALNYLSVVAGVLIPGGDERLGADPPYLFVHRTVAEYLVAEHLANMSASELLAAIEQHLWFDIDWSAIWPMLGALTSRGGQLADVLSYLSERHPDPANRALTTAVWMLGDLDRAQLPELQSAIDQIASELLQLLETPASTYAIGALAALMPLISGTARHVVDARVFTASSPEYRQAAAKGLRDRRGPEVVAKLISLAQDPDSAVRRVAAQSMQSHPGRDVDDALISMTEDTDGSVRWVAGQALQRRSGAELTNKLIELASSDSARSRHAAARSLASNFEPSVTQILQTLATDPSPIVRRDTVEALALRPGPAVQHDLLNSLHDPSASVRRSAARALSDRADPEGISMLATLARDDNAGIRAAVARALKGHQGREVVDALLRLAEDPSSTVRGNAAAAMRDRSEPALETALVDLLSDSAAVVRRAAAKALAIRGNTALKQTFIQMTSDSNTGVRKAAARALGHISGDEVSALLISLTRDGARSVRQTAIYALGSRAGAEVTNALLGLTSTTGHARDRIAAVKALARRPNDGIITRSIAELCCDSDVTVRHVAIATMASQRGDEVVRWLDQVADCDMQGNSTYVLSGDAAAVYETLIAIADNAQQWPLRERGRLLGAIERSTLALTGR
jgi:HEAT repeat protein